MKFEERVAIVTGSSRGIGRATALELAKQGAKVVVNYNKEKQKADEVVEEIKKLGSDAIAVKADVSKSKDIDKLIKQTIGKFGKIDILVNNAGVFIFTPIEKVTETDWNMVLDTNLKSHMFLTKAVAPYMKKQGSGAIINIASVFGAIEAAAGYSAYNASKAGVVALTKALALELAPEVRVNAVLPGIVETDMTAGSAPGEKARCISRTPAGRLGKPEEIAKIIAFLASDDASYINGEEITVDGGRTLKRFYN